MMLDLREQWLVPLGGHQSQPKLTLFCFSPAGAGVTFFRQWISLMPAWVNLWVVRFPGRETRLREPLITDWSLLVNALVPAIAVHCHQPFAMFGHSLGALVGFEMVCQLRDRFNALPSALVVSGRRPPQVPVVDRPYQRNDADLIAELRSDGGTPEAVLQNAELMALILPIYRADLQLNQNYQYQLREPLACPILAMGGQNDKTVPLESLTQWQCHTRSQFTCQLFPGKHMYLTQNAVRIATVQYLINFIVKKYVDSGNDM